MGYRHFGYLTKLTPPTKKKKNIGARKRDRANSLTLSRTNELTTIEDESYLSEIVSSSFCNTLDGSKESADWWAGS